MLRVAVSAVLAALLTACPQAPAIAPTRDGGDDDDPAGEGEGEGEPGQCDAASDKPVPGAGAVYFGTREPTQVPLTAQQKMAVVGLGFGQPPGASCSGTLITDDVVLTATHCTDGTPANQMYVTFGVDDTDPDLVIRVVEKTEHPELDIAMVRLASRATDQLAVTPIPPFSGALSSSDVGELFEQAGFGQTETGNSNGLFFVAEPFAGFEEGGFLMVDGEGRHGVCFGDSGGPSLRLTAEGDVRVMGALSFGDPSCTGIDRYTRVDLSVDWIEDFIGPIPPPGQTRPGCGSVTAAGRCNADGTVAEFCDGDALTRDSCGAGEVCGDDNGTKRCIPVADAPCGAVTAFGSCDGDVLSWCDNGVVRTRDCGTCGDEVCALVDNAVGFACIDDPCGGLSFQGECDGDVARWCENGEVKQVDCAAEGGRCGFVNDETGFFCQ
jgi:hypothetical protein